jgi:hypothetical protein
LQLLDLWDKLMQSKVSNIECNGGKSVFFLITEFALDIAA